MDKPKKDKDKERVKKEKEDRKRRQSQERKLGLIASRTGVVVPSLCPTMFGQFVDSYSASIPDNHPPVFFRYVQPDKGSDWPLEEDMFPEENDNKGIFKGVVQEFERVEIGSIAQNWNWGIHRSIEHNDAKYIFIFNDDILFPKPTKNHPATWIEDWFAYLEAYPEIGVCSAAWYGNKPGDEQGCWGYVEANKGEEDLGIQGCFFVIRREVVDQLIKKDGYVFDECFEIGNWEDVDFVKRVEAMGWKVCVTHSLALTHLGGSTLYNSDLVPEKGYSERNRERFFKKWQLDMNRPWTVSNARLIFQDE